MKMLDTVLYPQKNPHQLCVLWPWQQLCLHVSEPIVKARRDSTCLWKEITC